MGKKNINLILIFIIFSSILSYAAHSYVIIDEDSEKILKSKTLELNLISKSGVNIDNIQKPLNWISADFNNYPLDTYRQSILSKKYRIEPEKINETNIYFKEKQVSDDWKINQEYLIQTQNEYFPVKNKIEFPLKNLDDKYKIYTEPTEKININDEITATASTIASGKDDLFEVSQDVADWVTTNIQYDLSTITEDKSQKASWVISNRKGVCDELSILFISMMRSLGVPARMVSGISYTNSQLFSKNWLPHAWAEVYFPGSGWVPFDLTYKQFGFIDASHITFIKSQNTGSIRANYLWKGVGLDKIDFEIIPTTYEVEVKNYEGKVKDDIDISVSLFKDAVSFGSYNILDIKLKNNAEHYLSSILHISSPPEVVINNNKQLPVFVKPNEEKHYYIIMETSSDLSKNYEYEMPLYIRSVFGQQKSTQFKVSNRYSYVSMNQINEFMSEYQENNENKSVSMNCNVEEEKIYKNENTQLICMLKNEGNIYFEKAELCVEGDFDFSEICDNFSLPISKTHTFKTKLSSETEGSQKIKVLFKGNNLSLDKELSVYVEEKPEIVINKISFKSLENYGDDVIFNVSLDKKSKSIPQQVDVRILINGKMFNWNFENFSKNTVFKIPINSYYFVEGENEIKAFVKWEDSNEAQYHDEKTTTYNVARISLIEKIKSFFYRLIN